MSSFSLERYWLISLSSVHAQLQTLVTPWTVACQAPLFMKFSRQEYWSELSFPTTGDLLHPGMNLGLLNWQVDSLPLSHLRSPSLSRNCSNLNSYHQYISSVQSLSHVQLFATPWTITCQALLFMKFSRQEYWSGLPFPTLGNLLDPEIELMYMSTSHNL